MKSAIVACLRHNSCLSYVKYLASLETVPQCTSHASFLTYISQETRLRCGGSFLVNLLKTVAAVMHN